MFVVVSLQGTVQAPVRFHILRPVKWTLLVSTKVGWLVHVLERKRVTDE